jgi:hypothetical protein
MRLCYLLGRQFRRFDFTLRVYTSYRKGDWAFTMFPSIAFGHEFSCWFISFVWLFWATDIDIDKK